MATGAVIASYVAAAASAAGAVYQGVTTADAKKKQAKQVELNAEHNAQVLRNKAEQEKLDHQANSREKRRQQHARQEAIVGGVAKSGLMMEGTPTNTLLEQISVDEANSYDNDRISAMKQKNLELNAQNTLIEGNNTSKNLRSQARSSLISGALGATGAIAGGYYGAKQASLLAAKNTTTKIPTAFKASTNKYWVND